MLDLSETTWRSTLMSTRTFKATVRLPNGLHQEVFIEADSQSNARAMLEAQYGRGSILAGPWSLADNGTR
jgi:hypothetical protein